ncbi:Hypothetical predicted protein [Olea europaea subsp. europaea]|uniref:Uncharacterized protein n=1 Tax=Olea europaea subsp. europaea TaxID=158383 RepID=A0A8S0TIY4_OLEEU|nr:Hypothetical predicted protein [Olea europaea subsp. europaea]
MGGVLTESWFSNIWRSSRKSIALDPEKHVIGILAFEVSRLMSKVVYLWQCVDDRQIVGFREEVVNSLGIRKLVSDDDEYLMDLALAEILENLGSVAKSVTILGKKCTDPTYHNLERVFENPVEIDLNWSGWQYKLKKMEREVKKMERFVGSTEQLFQELEVLTELEQGLRRMQTGAGLNQVKLLEYQQKVLWQRQEVKNLREMSPWVRTYDYIVRLLLRSIFTIIERIKHVYGINHIENVEGINHYECLPDDCLTRNNSISAFLQLPLSPSENSLPRFPGPFGRSLSNLGLSRDKNRSRNKKLHTRSLSSLGCGKQQQTKSRRFDPVGPFKGCMTGGSDSPVLQSYTPSSSGSLRSNCASQRYADETKDTNAVPIEHRSITSSKVSFFNYKRQLLNAPPPSLGYAALALHYANIIILIEKLASSPHLISLDARDDLYNMLPASIRSCLRAKLKVFSKSLASCVYDAAFAANWSFAVSRILEWLSPLAHSMIRWLSERNFERQQMVSRTNVLLVQTLYFANQGETEAAIVELLMGLNYLSRFAQEITEKPFRDSSCSRGCDGNMFPKDNYYCNMIHHAS